MDEKLICFDMDNTLLDADKVHILSYNQAFKKNGLGEVKDEEIKPKFGIIGLKLVKMLFPKISVAKAKKICDDHHWALMKKTKKYIKPFPGVKNTLKKIRKCGYKIGVLSNCRHSEILTLIKTSKLDLRLFDIFIGNDDVKNPKPAPDIILKAEELLKMKVEYMVGDTIYDIIAGKKAGVKTIAVLTGNHTKERLKKEKPDYILKNVNEIPKILKC